MRSSCLFAVVLASCAASCESTPSEGRLARLSLPLERETLLAAVPLPLGSPPSEPEQRHDAFSSPQDEFPDETDEDERVDELAQGDERAEGEANDARERISAGVEPAAGEPAAGDSAAGHAAAAEPAAPSNVLVATRRQTQVWREPSRSSRAIGYLRSGATIERAGAKRSGAGCAAGFHPIEPQGYVCADEVSTDAEHLLASEWHRRPDRRALLPYFYGRSKLAPPVYHRIPSREEQREIEPALRDKISLRQSAWQEIVGGSLPEFLAEGRPSLRLDGQRRSPLVLSAGRALHDSAFAFVELFEVGSRYFGLSTELSVVPLDHLEPVRASEFAGVPLGRGHELPLVFVRAHSASVFDGHPQSGLRLQRRAEYREAFSLTGERVRAGGQAYLEVRGGQWLLETPELVRIDAVKPPALVRGHQSWIDVSIQRQSLVAYRGSTPIYATLVSTGADGLQDPETTRSTVQGEFRIHTKHVTATMSSAVEGDEYDLRDVPYVQYFSGGYALHTAFWHDGFGTPRSHGCINLSPLDARWLFEWSEPRVPEAWHGAMSLLEGTLISVHP